MFDVIFPLNIGQRYYQIHYEYVFNIFKYLKCRITLGENLDFNSTNTAFKCQIDGKRVIFDFADSNEYRKLGNDEPIFKFHTKKEDLDKVIPFAPVSFYDWGRYFDLEKKINYQARGFISSRQRPYAGALERRTRVQTLLYSTFKHDVAFDLRGQEDYWEEVDKVRLAVFVPGQNNNIYDRGHAQYLAFGCATISPFLPEVLPFNTPITANVHYIRCMPNYDDLVKLIQDVEKQRDYLLTVGKYAKELFTRTSTPEKLGEWINLCLK